MAFILFFCFLGMNTSYVFAPSAFHVHVWKRVFTVHIYMWPHGEGFASTEMIGIVTFLPGMFDLQLPLIFNLCSAFCLTSSEGLVSGHAETCTGAVDGTCCPSCCPGSGSISA